MDEKERRRLAHHLDVTVRVGKGGVDAVADEVRSQLDDREMVKVRFLTAARAGTSIEDGAEQLAAEADATVFETRGNTAVLYR